MASGSLVCRSCATSHDLSERFCPSCGMPLVYAPDVARGGAPVTEQHERARKVKPQYGEGALVKVGWAHNQAEAELVAGLLLEEGIPSVIRRSGGFDVPDFLAAGPRDILVAASGVEAAREVLAEQRPVPPGASPVTAVAPAESWVRVLAFVMVTVVGAGVLAAIATALFA